MSLVTLAENHKAISIPVQLGEITAPTYLNVDHFRLFFTKSFGRNSSTKFN
jgi:hypothetical protein